MLTSATAISVSAFAPIHQQIRIGSRNYDAGYMVGKSSGSVVLRMAAEGKKKRRRRKKKKSSPDIISIEPITEGGGGDAPPSIEELKAIADFSASRSVPTTPIESGEGADGSIEIALPDIKDALRNKELKRIEEEEKEERARPKISRKDKKAMLQLLEEQPYADADDSYFEEEEYGTVSALLGEGAKDFLGIPPGPLQVGHFIGTLGIILMAFVEYPGFPLTNLPTPLRDALQGGLATIFTVNAALAVLATFKAAERGQSSVLWAVKTFSVGGLALDQLTQLPTLKEVEEIANRKGARAVKGKK